MATKPKGKLIIAGGGDRRPKGESVLQAVADEVNAHKGQLLIVTAATQSPDGLPEDYASVFKELGLPGVDALDIRIREDGYEEANVKKCMKASVIFFTGGDQLRIASQMGDTPVFRCMRDIYQQGGVIVGTSAGAAAMAKTMIIGGPGDESSRAADLSMAPGLGLIDDVIIDSHFAERGRIGRLAGVVAYNPRNLGIGIDAGTAIVVEQGQRFTVIGSDAVYVIDGKGISYSSLSQEDLSGVLTIHGVQLHILGAGNVFDMMKREPVITKEMREGTSVPA
jgi:cyanophycinase